MSSKYLPASRPQALASAGGEYLEFESARISGICGRKLGSYFQSE